MRVYGAVDAPVSEHDIESSSEKTISNANKDLGKSRTFALLAVAIAVMGATFLVTSNRGLTPSFDFLSFKTSKDSLAHDNKNKNSVKTAMFPTPAPTYYMTMLYVTQRIDHVTLEQSNEAKFETAVENAVSTGVLIPLSKVQYTNSVTALYGDAVDCTYYIEAMHTNTGLLTAEVRGQPVTDNIKDYLYDAGYVNADASQQAIIVDVSPTMSPTQGPTYSKAVVQVTQQITGVSNDQVDDNFVATLISAVAGALQVAPGAVVWQGSEQIDNGIDVSYTVTARKASYADLSDSLSAASTTGAITLSLQSAGFEIESVEVPDLVVDASPTYSPTAANTAAIAVLEVTTVLTGVTEDEVLSKSFLSALKTGISQSVDVPPEAIDITDVTTEGTDLQSVGITYTVREQKVNPDDLAESLSEQSTQDLVAYNLGKAGFVGVEIKIADVSDISPTFSPTAAPTNLLTVLDVIQRIDIGKYPR